MLNIKKSRIIVSKKQVVGLFAVIMLMGGLYLLTLVSAPTIAPLVMMKPIEVSSLPVPQKTENRIVIPKIGVNIPYGTGKVALDQGAEWRYPERGNPEKGGNFVVAAHRFTLAPTPTETVRKSPFYHIDKLVVGDKIVVDYDGIRYGYEIQKIFDVKPTQVEIEAATDEAKLTLYTCELDGAESGRVVVVAKPLGKVALTATE
ncbi:MAG: class E sortase [Candidatus Saccharimonas sp.]